MGWAWTNVVGKSGCHTLPPTEPSWRCQILSSSRSFLRPSYSCPPVAPTPHTPAHSTAPLAAPHAATVLRIEGAARPNFQRAIADAKYTSYAQELETQSARVARGRIICVLWFRDCQLTNHLIPRSNNKKYTNRTNIVVLSSGNCHCESWCLINPELEFDILLHVLLQHHTSTIIFPKQRRHD